MAIRTVRESMKLLVMLQSGRNDRKVGEMKRNESEVEGDTRIVVIRAIRDNGVQKA